MRILVVHPRMSIMGGGERVAIHSMLAGMNMGHEVTLLSEEFDVQRFEDFFGCYGLFEKVRQLSQSSNHWFDRGLFFTRDYITTRTNFERFCQEKNSSV